MRAAKCAVCLDTVHFGRQAATCLGSCPALSLDVTIFQKTHLLARLNKQTKNSSCSFTITLVSVTWWNQIYLVLAVIKTS